MATASPRTRTAPYHFAPSTPLTPIAECGPHELLDIAAGAASSVEQLRALCASEPHVAALCRVLACDLDTGLTAALERVADLEARLVVSETMHLEELREVRRLQALLIALSEQHVHLLHGSVRSVTLAVAVQEHEYDFDCSDVINGTVIQ